MPTFLPVVKLSFKQSIVEFNMLTYPSKPECTPVRQIGIATPSLKLEVGDIIVFSASQTNPIIHRIIEIKESNGVRVFSTLGDNNQGQLSFEKEISEEQLVGKATFKVAPYLGWVKLIFYDWQKPESERGFCNEN